MIEAGRFLAEKVREIAQGPEHVRHLSISKQALATYLEASEYFSDLAVNVTASKPGDFYKEGPGLKKLEFPNVVHIEIVTHGFGTGYKKLEREFIEKVREIDKTLKAGKTSIIGFESRSKAEAILQRDSK